MLGTFYQINEIETIIKLTHMQVEDKPYVTGRTFTCVTVFVLLHKKFNYNSSDGKNRDPGKNTVVSLFPVFFVSGDDRGPRALFGFAKRHTSIDHKITIWKQGCITHHSTAIS
jgi:hypothetical protein